MRKGHLLIGALVFALAVSASGMALGARTMVQTLVGEVSPVSLPKTQYRNAKLHLVTELRDSKDLAACSSADPPEECITPPKSNASNIDFDDDVRFNPRAAARCAPATVSGKTTAEARAACPNAIVGTGLAVARGGVVGEPASPSVTKSEATLFNATPDPQGRPRLILKGEIGGAGVDFVGTLIESPLGAGYGKRLRLPVPPIGLASTRVDVTVSKGSYVRARCRDRDRRLNFHGYFTYFDSGAPPNDYPASATDTSTSPCTVNTAPYRPCVRKARRAFRRKRRIAIRRYSGLRRTRAIRRAKRQRRIAIRRCARLHLP